MEPKKILIVDENGFGRICSALLAMDGYRSERLSHVSEIDSGARFNEFGLIITSFPYGAGLFDTVRDHNVPLLVLSDCLNDDLLEELKKLHTSYCMVKPIDYDKFSLLVGQVLSGHSISQGGCRIV